MTLAFHVFRGVKSEVYQSSVSLLQTKLSEAKSPSFVYLSSLYICSMLMICFHLAMIVIWLDQAVS